MANFNNAKTAITFAPTQYIVFIKILCTDKHAQSRIISFNQLSKKVSHLYFFFNFIYLFLLFAVLGLSCCSLAFSSLASRGYSLVAVHGLLIAVASLAAEHRFQGLDFSSCGSQALEHRLSSCGARDQLLSACGIFLDQGWNLLSLALVGRFFTTEPLGKLLQCVRCFTQIILFNPHRSPKVWIF